MKALSTVVLLSGVLAAQSVGPAVNVLFPSNNNLFPANQPLVISADGSFVAVTGALNTIADVLIANMSSTGAFSFGTQILFPSNNDVHPTNNALVASRRGRYLVCYGSNGTVGDLVFMTRDTMGNWIVTNVTFPSANDVPVVGTKPVISDDEEFIVCRGLPAIADIVIVPVTIVAGVYTPGPAFNEVVPGGNSIPLSAVDPVIAPNSLTFAINGASASIGDLVLGVVGKPVSAVNTTLQNVLFPSGNNVVSNLVPPAVSPMSNYYACHGFSATGDLVIVPVSPIGVLGTLTNVLFPLSNNTANTGTPPTISGDGRLIAVNGTDATNGDVVLVPVNSAGIPGAAANVAFPASNNLPNNQLPPVISPDAALVLQRGSATIGDLVAMQVTFTSPTTISGTTQNILYPSNNNFPDINAGIALAADRSFAATLGSSTLGDLVITPFDIGGIGQTPINILYPSSNNVANVGTTPRISRDGNLIITSGFATIGDAVVTGVAVNAATGFIQNIFTVNVLYPAFNDNSPAGREPVFSPTTQFAVSSGVPTIGDLVFIPLMDAFPRFRARGDAGVTVPVRLFSPPDAGKTVIAGAAFGRYPGITLPPPDNRIVPLNPDLLLSLSLDPTNTVFTGFVGVLDVNGVYDGGAVNVPPFVSLEGFYFYVAFVVLEPTGIGTISRPSIFLVE